MKIRTEKRVLYSLSRILCELWSLACLSLIFNLFSIISFQMPLRILLEISALPSAPSTSTEWLVRNSFFKSWPMTITLALQGDSYAEIKEDLQGPHLCSVYAASHYHMDLAAPWRGNFSHHSGILDFARICACKAPRAGHVVPTSCFQSLGFSWWVEPL